MPDESGSMVQLAGSERAPLPHAMEAGPLDASRRAEVTLVLRRRAELPEEIVVGPTVLSGDELAGQYGADPADVDLVRRELSSRGLEVTAVHPVTRRVKVAGTLGDLSSAFGTTLRQVTSPDPAGQGQVPTVTARGRSTCPPRWAASSPRCSAWTPCRRPGRISRTPAAAAARGTSYTPSQVADISRGVGRADRKATYPMRRINCETGEFPALSSDAAASALENFEKMLAAGKDGALLRFSLGNEHLKAGDERGRGASRARGRARPRIHRRMETLWQGARRGRAQGRTRSPRIVRASRWPGRAATSRRRRRCGSSPDGSKRADSVRRSGSRSGSRRRCRAHSDAAVGERVGALVARMAVVTLDPVPADLVPRASASSSRHRSAFFTGFRSAVFQPFLFQPWIHVSMPFFTYCESVWSVDGAGARSALRARDDGGQLHAVVGGGGLAAEELLLARRRRRAARPSRPGPGLPLHAPSV